jgi:uridine kinase
MFIIGISGGTGSGKTTFVNNIITELTDQEISVISQDSYYHETTKLSKKERLNINFDHPESIDFNLLTKHILSLKKGEDVAQPIYSFLEHNRLKETTTTIPKKIIIVEGILILSNTELRNLLDLSIYIDVDDDERLIRRVKRDCIERGRNMNEVFNRYQDTLKPMHQKYIENSKKHADIIIPNNKFNRKGINIVKTIIKEKLS